jgi:acyl-CoA reductase-like NAD-dependent aldehyde dehydrogenase
MRCTCMAPWTFPVWWGCRCALRVRKPLCDVAAGALNPVYLKHSAWKKRLAGWLDRACLRRAAAVHVTSEAEREWVEAYCDHGVVAMASVKTGAGRAGARGACAGREERRTPNSQRSTLNAQRSVGRRGLGGSW